MTKITFDVDELNKWFHEWFNDYGRVIGLRVNEIGIIERFNGYEIGNKYGEIWLKEDIQGKIEEKIEDIDDDQEEKE
jgi:hypothetical protein